MCTVCVTEGAGGGGWWSPDVSHGVGDQLQRLQEEVLTEVGFREEVYSDVAQVQKP